MRRGRPIAGLWGIVAIGGFAPAAFAAGFQLQEQTASGLGVAFSGMPVAAQDAGTAFWNPAALHLVPETQFSLAVHYIDTSFEFTGTPGGVTYASFGDGGNAGGGSIVPAAYAKFPINDKWTLGWFANVPFGLKTEWNPPWAGQFHAIDSEVRTLNLAQSVGYRVNNSLSLGANISYQKLDAELSTGVSPLVPTAQARVEGDDWAIGWTFGALYDFGQGTRVGVTYRSSTDYKVAGDLAFNDPAFANMNTTASARIELPETAAIGISHELMPGLRVLADYTWTGWDSIQALTVVSTGPGTEGQVLSDQALNFDHSWRAGIGVEYQLNPQWLLRVGTAYDESPVLDQFRTPRLPDEDRKWLSVGARFQPTERWVVDVGYAHLWVSDAPSNLAPPGPLPGALLGSYDSDSNLFGAQVSVSF